MAGSRGHADWQHRIGAIECSRSNLLSEVDQKLLLIGVGTLFVVQLRTRDSPRVRHHYETEWVRKGKAGQRESINIDFYEVASSTDAAQWMTRFDRGELSKDWQANRYELGDEAYLLNYRNGSRYSIYFRKNHIVVEVSGTALKGVERFAKYVAEMTAT